MNTWTKTLFIVIYTLIISGMLVPMLLTLLPGEASKLNHLGYMSRCSFAPWSTLSLLGITLLLVGIAYLFQLGVTG